MFNDRFGLTDATLEGRKTVTRRIAKRKDLYQNDARILAEPQYKLGEIFDISKCYDTILDSLLEPNGMVRAWIPESAGFRNKMFVKAELMPHQIEILDVRVERLQDITDEDCIKEGIIPVQTDDGVVYQWRETIGPRSAWIRTPKSAYACLIDSIDGKGTWDNNPYVFRYEFKLK